MSTAEANKDNSGTTSCRKTFRKVLKAAAWILGIWLCTLLIIRIILSPSVIDRLIDRYASEYVEGDINIGKVKLSVFRHFPNIGVSVDDFSITYPTYEDTTAKDTLAYFKNFSARLNIVALATGKINIPYAGLSRLRINAHRYKDGTANWEIIRIPSDTTENESGGIPDIKLGRIKLTDRPHITYTDEKADIHMIANLGQARLNGKLNPGKNSRNRIGLRVDSLSVEGSTAQDTLAFMLNHLGITEKDKTMHILAKANADVSTKDFGRLEIPIELRSGFSFPKDTVPAIAIKGLKAEIGFIPLEGDMDLRFKQDRIGVNGAIAIKDCKAEEIIERFLKGRVPMADKLLTDAIFTIEAECSGDYIASEGTLPETFLKLNLPESEVLHRESRKGLKIKAEVSAQTGQKGSISASVDDMKVRCEGLSLDASGSIPDLMEDDFLINVDGNLTADLSTLINQLPHGIEGLDATGLLNADIEGSIRPSHIDIYRFSHCVLKGSITGDSITMVYPKDSLDLRIENMALSLGPEIKTSKVDSGKTYSMMAVKGEIGKADISYGTMGVNGDRIKVSAMSSVEESTTHGRLGGRVNAARISLTDASGIEVEFKETANGFQMIPKKDRPEVPMLTVSSDNSRIMLKDGTNRLILTDAKVGASAAMNTVERKQKAAAFMDSLARIYPDVPKDSLMSHMTAQRQKRSLPEWLSEEDFRKKDINIKLDETLAKYFREWDLNGRIDVRTGILMTPYFPTRNILRGFEVGFTNDRISIDSVKVRAGDSEIGAKGELTGLRRALLGRGGLKLDMDIMSDKVNANQLLAAYNSGSRYTPPEDNEAIEEATDAEFFKMVTSDTLSAADTVTPLLVIPANLNADIRLNASNITYSDLNISNLHSKLTMKERCVQITDTKAASNMGNIGFEGFYATRSKKNIQAGFSFNLNEITAEKVINMVPAVDSLMPLLKSFNGELDCELAATARIDTNMNIIPPSINGIIRIQGKDLSIKDSDIFRDLAKKLMFKNKDEGYVDKMSVEGVISDSMIEVFPFIVKMDRYTLALSGIHRMDESFKYHASLLKSPFLIKLGIDVYGDNLDDMKFKIGKAKYKNTEVPIFSAVLDTTKLNLVKSIRGIFEKGVEAAVSENERKEAIEKLKQDIGYVRAVDQELEGLSEKERMQIETDEAAIKDEDEIEESADEAFEELTADLLKQKDKPIENNNKDE